MTKKIKEIDQLAIKLSELANDSFKELSEKNRLTNDEVDLYEDLWLLTKALNNWFCEKKEDS